MDQLLDTLVAPKERAARAARIQRAAQQNVGEILVHIARHQCTPMITQLTAPSYLARMLEAAAAADSEVLQPVSAPRCTARVSHQLAAFRSLQMACMIHAVANEARVCFGSVGHPNKLRNHLCQL